MKKFKPTSFLLICVVVLGGFIWAQEFWRSRAPAKHLAQVRLFDLHPAQLNTLQLIYPEETVVVSKTSDGWVSSDSELEAGLADVALVHQMLGNLNSLQKEAVITAEQLKMRGLKAAEYGFDSPTMRIVAEGRTGRQAWSVGRKTALENMYYIRKEGVDEIYTVTDAIVNLLPTHAGLLRNRVVFPGGGAGIRQVELRRSSGYIQLVKGMEPSWLLQQPVTARIDLVKMETFLDQLHRVRIEAFFADKVADLSVYGLMGEDGDQISMSSIDGTSRTLILGDACPDKTGFLYARMADSTSVFLLEESVRELLNTRYEDLRDPVVLPEQAADVNVVEIIHGGTRLKLERGSDDERAWSLVEPVRWMASSEVVDAFIQHWSGALISDTNEFGKTEWDLRFINVSGETNRIEVAQAPDTEGACLVRFSGSSEEYEVNVPIPEKVFADPLTYKSLDVWMLDTNLVQKITLMRKGEDEQRVVRDEDQGLWKLSDRSGTKGDVNTTHITDLLLRVQKLRAESYVRYNPQDLSLFGLDKPSAALQFTLNSRDELGRILLLGNTTNRMSYAMVQGEDVVFLLNQSVGDRLKQDLAIPAE